MAGLLRCRRYRSPLTDLLNQKVFACRQGSRSMAGELGNRERAAAPRMPRVTFAPAAIRDQQRLRDFLRAKIRMPRAARGRPSGEG